MSPPSQVTYDQARQMAAIQSTLILDTDRQASILDYGLKAICYELGAPREEVSMCTVLYAHCGSICWRRVWLVLVHRPGSCSSPSMHRRHADKTTSSVRVYHTS